MSKSEDCASQLHDFCNQCDCECHGFSITIDEARALNFFLQVHGILLKDNPDEYLHILRLINGIPQFLDKHGK